MVTVIGTLHFFYITSVHALQGVKKPSKIDMFYSRLYNTLSYLHGAVLNDDKGPYLIFVVSFTQAFCVVEIFYTQNALFVTKLNSR